MARNGRSLWSCFPIAHFLDLCKSAEWSFSVFSFVSLLVLPPFSYLYPVHCLLYNYFLSFTSLLSFLILFKVLLQYTSFNPSMSTDTTTNNNPLKKKPIALNGDKNEDPSFIEYSDKRPVRVCEWSFCIWLLAKMRTSIWIRTKALKGRKAAWIQREGLPRPFWLNQWHCFIPKLGNAEHVLLNCWNSKYPRCAGTISGRRMPRGCESEYELAAMNVCHCCEAIEMIKKGLRCSWPDVRIDMQFKMRKYESEI